MRIVVTLLLIALIQTTVEMMLRIHFRSIGVHLAYSVLMLGSGVLLAHVFDQEEEL